MLRQACLLSLLMCLALAIPPAATAEGPASVASQAAPGAGTGRDTSPTRVVETLHEAIVHSMKNAEALGFERRYELLEPVIAKAFDLNFMGAKCVGRHWNKLSEAEQKSWLEKFTRLTTSNYAGRFNQYAGESFETLSEEPAARSTRVVFTKLLVPGDEDVRLDYRLRETNGDWRIIDVYLKGTVSELALRRSDFSSTLKREGFEELVAAVDRKIEDLKEKGGG